MAHSFSLAFTVLRPALQRMKVVHKPWPELPSSSSGGVISQHRLRPAAWLSHRALPDPQRPAPSMYSSECMLPVAGTHYAFKPSPLTLLTLIMVLTVSAQRKPLRIYKKK